MSLINTPYICFTTIVLNSKEELTYFFEVIIRSFYITIEEIEEKDNITTLRLLIKCNRNNKKMYKVFKDIIKQKKNILNKYNIGRISFKEKINLITDNIDKKMFMFMNYIYNLLIHTIPKKETNNLRFNIFKKNFTDYNINPIIPAIRCNSRIVNLRKQFSDGIIEDISEFEGELELYNDMLLYSIESMSDEQSEEYLRILGFQYV